ncbi:BCCT family transporter [Bacillus marinisedimentorum]|uniref:BCCT family transporter n=1 Tax=Bacillus marinisedimentorum TaxID=1821260 RepID=UPI001FE15437|nr:BCCT family transporter [Bacillus marinisedimentorum]
MKKMKAKIDPTTFISTFALLLAVCIPLIMFPEKGAEMLSTANSFVTDKFGPLYLWGGFGALLFLTWVTFSKYGNITLGKPEEKPQFSTFSWAGMMFCAGIGSSIMYWGAVEWAYYYQSPPYALEAKSAQAIEWAATYGIFHWGPTAWAIYTLPALPIAYLYHVKKKPILKISEACRPILGKLVDGPLGKTIDILFMFSLLGGAGTTLGLGTPMISAGITEVTGIQRSLVLDISVLLIVTVIFSVSAYSGLEKGIKKLSDINLLLSFGFLVFVLVAGPTLFIMKMSTNATGLLMDNFFRMNLWTDPVLKSGFPEAWTVFYWAWWIVYAPFIGLFVAKISKGRTIRQTILGAVGWGSLGSALYFMILGNYGMYLELNNIVPVTQIMAEQGTPEAIIAIIAALPLGKLMVTLFTVTAIVFLATTFDSSSYTLAAVTQNMVVGDPFRWNRLFWAFSLAVLPMTLMFVGGLEALQTVSILVALPIVIIMFGLAASFVKLVRRDREIVMEHNIAYQKEAMGEKESA